VGNIATGEDLGTMLEVGTIDNKRIVLSVQPLNFYQAYRLCEQTGGSLMRIENEAENDLIQQYLLSNSYQSKSLSAWIGAWRLGENGTTAEYFYWLNSGVALTAGYSNWQPGAPDNGADHLEQCVHLYYGFGYNWNDINCEVACLAVCEIKMMTVNTCSTFTGTFSCSD
jgi:hypothetical protein